MDQNLYNTSWKVAYNFWVNFWKPQIYQKFSFTLKKKKYGGTPCNPEVQTAKLKIKDSLGYRQWLSQKKIIIAYLWLRYKYLLTLCQFQKESELFSRMYASLPVWSTQQAPGCQAYTMKLCWRAGRGECCNTCLGKGSYFMPGTEAQQLRNFNTKNTENRQ